VGAVSALEGIPKPYPEIFRRAGPQLRASRSTVRAGWSSDNPAADIGGAVLTGLRSIWIDRGHDWTEPAYRPDHVVGGPLAAIELLPVAD